MKKNFLFMVPLLAIAIVSCKSENPSETTAEKKTIHVTQFCDGGEDEDPLPMISGIVTDDSQNPIHGACVRVTLDTGTPVDIIGSDANGHYFFNTMADGNYLLITTADGYPSDTIPFEIDDQLAVTLDPILD